MSLLVVIFQYFIFQLLVLIYCVSGASSAQLWAFDNLPANWLLVPRVSGCFLQCCCREINMSRLAVLLWANVHNLGIYCSLASFCLDAFSTWSSSLLEVSFVHSSEIRLILPWKTSRIEAACISACLVHLPWLGVCRCNSSDCLGSWHAGDAGVENGQDCCDDSHGCISVIYRSSIQICISTQTCVSEREIERHVGQQSLEPCQERTNTANVAPSWGLLLRLMENEIYYAVTRCAILISNKFCRLMGSFVVPRRPWLTEMVVRRLWVSDPTTQQSRVPALLCAWYRDKIHHIRSDLYKSDTHTLE